MRTLTMFFVVLFVSFHCAGQVQIASAQESGVKSQKPDSLPITQRAFRPNVSLQEALKIPEDYINQQHIAIRPFWLYRAIYILSGDKKTPDRDKIPGWHFWWVNENGSLGDYVEIFVDMNGNASRVPSM